MEEQWQNKRSFTFFISWTFRHISGTFSVFRDSFIVTGELFSYTRTRPDHDDNAALPKNPAIQPGMYARAGSTQEAAPPHCRSGGKCLAPYSVEFLSKLQPLPPKRQMCAILER